MCSDFREAMRSGLITEEIQQDYENHIEHDRVQRSAFRMEKARAKSAMGLIVCIFDFSTSQETPNAKIHIGTWVIIYTGHDGTSKRVNLDVISDHRCNYAFVGSFLQHDFLLRSSRCNVP